MRKHQKSDLSVKTALELYTSKPTVLGFEKVTPSVGVLLQKPMGKSPAQNNQ